MLAFATGTADGRQMGLSETVLIHSERPPSDIEDIGRQPQRSFISVSP
jgi:hypothetical protein